ncbi:MAG: electron transfer flavoprotein subunit beta/FixA family protein [Elusimicrobia bacterium]|nr:electron transfer flavoprotein subunit beta/FixA family protein [Elusimicrobiota bacterium]
MPLNIVVCVKLTPSTANIEIDPATGSLRREKMSFAINPFDEYAVEEGVRLKERIPGSWVGALSLGAPDSEAALRESIARGVDEAFLISGPAFEGSDTFATGYALAMGIKKIAQIKGRVDLVICAKQTNDSDTGQVGPAVAAWLGWPGISFVKKVEEVSDKFLRLHRMMEDGYDVIEADLPAVIAVLKEINEPRLASLKGKMAAKKAAIPRWGAAELGVDESKIGRRGSPCAVAQQAAPPARPQGHRIQGGSPQEKAKQLVEKLQELKLI